MTADNRVVVIGDALIDELRADDASTEFPGGSALNVAVGLSILGVPATLIAMIGDDPQGDTLHDFAAGFGVRVLRSPAPLGTGRAISDRTHGEPRYSFSEASVRRTLAFPPEFVDEIAAASLVAISGFPFDSPHEFATLERALGDARSRTLIDPNPRPGLMLDETLFRANLERLSASAALVKLGEDDAALLYGEPVTAVAERFVALGTSAVLATMGADGAALHLPGDRIDRPIVPDARPLVDTMGAGDATFATVLASLVDAQTAVALSPAARPRAGSSVLAPDRWRDILATAMAVAAETIRHEGAQLRQP